jgi:glutamate/aspartate transport system substrate-binding protein
VQRLSAAFAALALLPALVFAQSAPPLDGRLKKIRDSQSIAVAYRADAIPFSFEDSSKQATGYTVDLCRRVVGAIEQQLGLKELRIRWVPVTLQNRFEAVAKGEADLECGASTVTLGRMRTVDFSSFVFVDGTGLLVKAGTGAKTLGDLGGKKIGVIAGTSNEKAVNEALKSRVVNATVITVKSREEGLAQVESGAIDAFASDRILLVGLASKAKDPKSFSLLTEALSFEPYAITLPRGDWQLRLAVNTALAQIYRSGAIGEIYGRWFSAAFGPPAPIVEMTYLFGALPE